MNLDRLTQRARGTILSLPPKNAFKAEVIFDAIKKAGGMGTHLISIFPAITYKRDEVISLESLIKRAFYHAVKFEHSYVGTEHLLLAVLSLSDSENVTRMKVEIQKAGLFPQSLAKNFDKPKKTPILDAFGTNINNKVLKDFDKPLLDRPEYENLVSVLLQKNNYNALLVGESGVGKKSLIELLARNISMFEVPPVLIGYQVIEFDLLAFMTNIFNRGGNDLGLNNLMDELKLSGRVILSIKNFQNVFFATNLGFTIPMFYSMFRSSLDQSGAKVITTMNPSLYEKIVAENEHIFDNFSVIEISEPSEDLTLKILERNSMYLGNFHNVLIGKDIIRQIYRKAKDKLKEIKFPQKGLNLLDQACSRLIFKKSRVFNNYKTLMDKTYMLAQTMDKTLYKGDYETALKTLNKIKKIEEVLFGAEAKILSTEKLKLTAAEVDETIDELQVVDRMPGKAKDFNTLSRLDAKIKRRIIGQDTAVDVVVKGLIRGKLGLRSKKRPLGNFLFLGPTGVGKTELAKVLSEEFFEPGSLIRLDMSDFAEKHTVARLVGAPPGYVGYGEGGELTQKIEAKPNSVVLFDEIEKAHPDVLNILLQIMDEGELSDAKGNTFDFSKSVIILTSNLGTDIIQNKGIGFDESRVSDENVEGRLKANLKKIIKPELLNRFDEIIVFSRLKKDSQIRIIDLLITDIQDTLAAQNVVFKVNKKAKEYLLKKGYSDEYGARSLRRTLEKELLDRVAEILLAHKERPMILKCHTAGSTLSVDLR